MHIILDTNIYQSDFSLQGTRFQALRSYLKKSEDKLIIPYIVGEELKINYLAALKKSLKEIQRVNREFRKVCVSKELNLVHQSIAKQIEQQSKLHDKMGDGYVDLIQRNIGRVTKLGKGNYNLDDITLKALKKEPPFNENGSGLKDTLIWLDVLSYCSLRKDKQIIFISNNSRDFGENNLHPELMREAGCLDLKIHYYNNLDRFIDDRFKSIENLELNAEDIDQEMLQILVSYWLKHDPQSSRSFLNFNSMANKKYIDYVGLHSLEVKEIKEFVVKDIGLDYNYIHGTMECDAGLAAATVRLSFDGSEMDHKTAIEEVKTDILIIFSIKYANNEFYDLEVVEVFFP